MLAINEKLSLPDNVQDIHSRNSINSDCYCTLIVDPQSPHQCQLCKKKISACPYVNELQHKITQQAVEIEALKKELQSYEAEINKHQLNYQTLNNKYIAGMEQVAHIKQQKEQADREIEELSAKLFEEANGMVAIERKKSIQLEKMLQLTEDQLQAEQGQLRELKTRIESIVSVPQDKIITYESKSKLKDIVIQTNSIESNKHERRHTKTTSAVNLSTIKLNHTEKFKADPGSYQQINSPKKICIDVGQSSIRLFQSYIDQFTKKKSANPNTISCNDSVIILSQVYITKEHEYIQLCEKEDIEPCLQFGTSTTRICTKTMMERMIQKPCFIETISLREARRMPPAINSSAIYRPFWERLTANSCSDSSLEDLYIECVACKRKFHILQYLDQSFYRFRLDEQEDWLLLDKACRNRLVAICDFYSFLRNIQLGHYQGSSLKDLYVENVQLRMQIFYSR